MEFPATQAPLLVQAKRSTTMATAARGTPESRSADTGASMPGLHAYALAAGLLSVAGLWCFADPLRDLWALWTQDPLRSIGILIPPASAWLALRAWRPGDWSRGGTCWGLGLMIAAMGLARLSADGPLTLQLMTASGTAAINLIPTGVTLSAYVSGAVLLFGGWCAWRRARFALLLLVLVNPVPGVLNTWADLPLQALAARSARAFAAALNVPVDGNALKLMFAPNLGMFIAPGCDGLYGAATMGVLALIVGHLRALPMTRHALYVFGAVAVAYSCNLLRLCGVVIYYWFALRIPAIADYGTEADYLIGGAVFFLAAAFLFSFPRLGRSHA